jgi:hypothetical protein
MVTMGFYPQNQPPQGKQADSGVRWVSTPYTPPQATEVAVQPEMAYRKPLSTYPAIGPSATLRVLGTAIFYLPLILIGAWWSAGIFGFVFLLVTSNYAFRLKMGDIDYESNKLRCLIAAIIVFFGSTVLFYYVRDQTGYGIFYNWMSRFLNWF